jgi:hypothetical protein
MRTALGLPNSLALLVALSAICMGCGSPPPAPAPPPKAAKAAGTLQQDQAKQAALVKRASERLEQTKRAFEFTKKRVADNEKLHKAVAAKIASVSEFPAFPQDRAVRDTPESFEQEITLSEKYVAELANAPSLEACHVLAKTHQAALDKLYRERYAGEIAAYRKQAFESLGQEQSPGYLVVEIEPPFSTFESFLFATFALIDLAAIPADLAHGKKPFTLSEQVTANAGQLQVVVFPTPEAAADYVTQAVFIGNNQSGLMHPEGAPWKLVKKTAKLADAQNEASRAARVMQSRYDAQQDNDHRKVKVISLATPE